MTALRFGLLMQVAALIVFTLYWFGVLPTNLPRTLVGVVVVLLAGSAVAIGLSLRDRGGTS